jgi:hypothetical protein
MNAKVLACDGINGSRVGGRQINCEQVNSLPTYRTYELDLNADASSKASTHAGADVHTEFQ